MSGMMNLNSTNRREIRNFGFVVFIFFGFLCALGLWLKKPLPTYLFGFFTILGSGFIFFPSRLKPTYNAWLKITHFMGKVATAVMLTLAYYLVITPSALLKQIFGGRPLPVKPDKMASSYWINRNEPSQPRERFFKRY
jgi:hypothetical protein